MPLRPPRRRGQRQRAKLRGPGLRQPSGGNTDRVRFDFQWQLAYRLAAAPYGIGPRSSHVTVADGRLEARFGPWRLRTPVANIRSLERTGPYAFLKTAGPPHLGWTDRGLTFATNSAVGLLLHFDEPVPGIEPLGVVRHPELTVTVRDIGEVIDALGLG